MSKLIIPSKIVSGRSVDESDLTFSRVIIQADRDSPGPDEVYRAESPELIYAGKDTTVFRAVVRTNKHDEFAHAVLKMDVEARLPRNEEYRREFENYNAVFDIQGTVVPICYGLYEAVVYGKLVSVLVLDDCGEPVRYDTKKVRLDVRKSIFSLVTCLHGFGYEHNDLTPGNILTTEEGHIFLTDLEDIRPHKCGVPPVLTVGDFTPSLQEFGCIELHKIARHLKLWEPPTIDFYGFDVPVEVFEAGAQKVLDFLPEYFRRSDSDKAILLKEAEKDIARIKKIRADVAFVNDPTVSAAALSPVSASA
ncbi:hypothetical protein ONZ45_g17826 [Pleurotus djamor]|nr:hypothetical protein ONZ45_g17826 [Pleurotus djamor]